MLREKLTRQSPLKLAFLSVFMGNMVTAGLSFFLNVLLSRMLSVSEFGKISLLFSLVITFFTISDFGFSNTTIIFYNRYKNSYQNNPLHYLNSIYLRFWLVVCLISVLVIVLFIRGYFELSNRESFLIFWVFIPFMLFRYLNSCNQAYGKWLNFNILNISNKLIQFLSIMGAIFILSYITGKFGRYNSALIGYAIYPILLLLLSLYMNHDFLHFKRPQKDKKQVFSDISKIALPLGMTNIFVIISMRFGYLATDKLLGSEALGIFSAANTLALVFPLITTSLMNVLLRETATRKQEFLSKIVNNQKRYAPYIVVILAAGILLSKTFILLIFGDKYIESISVFRILLIPYIGGIFFTPLQSYFYSHQAKTIMIVQFIQMMIVILGSIFLAGQFDLLGVALAIALSRIAGWIYISISAMVILKKSKMDIDHAS